MSGTRLLRSDGAAGALLNWTTALAGGGAPAVRATTRDVFVLAATAINGRTSSAAPAAPGRTSNRSQKQFRLRAGAAGPMPGRPPEPRPETAPAMIVEPVAESEPDAPDAADEARPSPLGKYTTYIETLDNYELLRFIPVTIEPLADRVFVAEAADLNLTITGQTAEDAIQLLKELLIRVYEGNRSKRHHLDVGGRRQQRTLETYIGRPKGSWHWA